MQADRTLWPTWARLLRRWGLNEAAATLLDAAGPLTVVGAQLLYFGQPLLNQALPAHHLTALAGMFENQSEIKLFTAFLREEHTLWTGQELLD